METLTFTPSKKVVNRNQSFLKAWQTNHILANVLCMGVLHTATSHTITGPHGVSLTPAQFILHTLSLFIFAIILNLMQNKALQLRFERNNFTDLSYFLTIIPVAFWLGYYTLYIPFDIIFMYLAIGGINAFRLKSYFKDGKKWTWQIMGAMLGGAVVGVLGGFAIYFIYIKDHPGLMSDFILWVCISLPASITYASISKAFLKQNLEKE